MMEEHMNHLLNSNSGDMNKRADKRSSMNIILVLGDEGVGKSSLISTYLARYFSEVVPKIMTRVRLPPDPENAFETIIVDSQFGDAELPESVDSIVLVYDLNRVETFSRLENHWLPLIERCYNGKIPVIVAENKVDLYRPSSISSSSNVAASATESFFGLMQRFPFLRQFIKCSAKDLRSVTDVFVKAQQAALYPYPAPLYNLEMGQLSPEFERALKRIFRIFDKDHDFILSEREFYRFLVETYQSRIFEPDFRHVKDVLISNHATALAAAPTFSGGPGTLAPEPLLHDGDYTLSGFFAVFAFFINANRIDVVWKSLRPYGYDDDLNLHIPKSVIWPNCIAATSSREPTGVGSSNKQQLIAMMRSWRLSLASQQFLEKVFHQFDSDSDGMLSQDDVLSIFSVLPPPALPPWHPLRAQCLFDAFSRPKQSLSISGIASSPSGGSLSGSEASSIVSRDFANQMAESPLIVPGSSSPPNSLTTLISHGGLSIFSASDSLPSIDIGGMYPLSKSLSFLEWMGHWHAISAISPAIARMELYRLGHIEDYGSTRHKKSKEKRKKKSAITEETEQLKKSKSSSKLTKDSAMQSHQLHVLVLGSHSCGKTALLNVLCGALDKKFSEMGSPVTVQATDTAPTKYPETSATFVRIKRKATTASSTTKSTPKKYKVEEGEFVVHLVFTDVPENIAGDQVEELRDLLGSGVAGNNPSATPKNSSNTGSVFDLVMLVFDSTIASSFAFVKELESNLLPNDAPRVFIGTKTDQITQPDSGDGDSHPNTAIDAAIIHCRELDLEPPLLTSAAEVTSCVASNKVVANWTFDGPDKRLQILNHISRCALSNVPGVEPLKARPHEERKRKEASRRRTMMWLGGIVTVGVAVVAVSVGLFWGSSSSKSKDQEMRGGSFSWIRSWFGGEKRNSARPAVTE